MRITLQCSYHHAKGEAAPGDVIDVDKAEAERLIDLGVASVASATASKQKPVATPKATTTGDAGATPPETGGGDGGNTGGTDGDNSGTGE